MEGSTIVLYVVGVPGLLLFALLWYTVLRVILVGIMNMIIDLKDSLSRERETGRRLSPNPPKDTDGRREDRRRGMRELQGRWPGLDWGRWEVGGGTSVTAQAPNGRLRELGCAGWQ